jgi:hypothetical protein
VPDAAAWTTVFDVPALRIEIRPGSGLPVDGRWWQVRLHARSAPFAGTIDSAWFREDLHALRAAVTGIVAAADAEAAWTEGDPLPEDDEAATFVVGGNRGPELRASGGLANTGEVLWLVLRVTPNGDDPYPSLTMHMFEDRARVLARMRELDAVLSAG